MSPSESFRQEVRDWLEENCPPAMRTPMPEAETVWGGRGEQFVNPESRVWLERMAAKGWTFVHLAPHVENADLQGWWITYVAR